MYQITEGLAYLHERGVVFRNLKPENIVFTNKNDLSSLKICNFEYAMNLSSEVIAEPETHDNYYFQNYAKLLKIERKLRAADKERKKPVGTYIYMAPEMISGKDYDEKVDTWSLGVIFYLLLTNMHPLQHLSDGIRNDQIKDKVLEILTGDKPSELVDFEIDELKEVDSDVVLILKKLLHIDPEKRLTTFDLLENYPFFKTGFEEYCKRHAKFRMNEFSPNSGTSVSCTDNTDIQIRFEDVMTKTASHQGKMFRKMILDLFYDQLPDQEEYEELSTLFDSLELNENSSIDQDNIDMFYSVYAEGNPIEDDEGFDKLEEYKKLMGTKDQYSKDDFIKSVVVFKNLMHPSRQMCTRIFQILDPENRGYFTLGELREYLSNTNHDLSILDALLE